MLQTLNLPGSTVRRSDFCHPAANHRVSVSRAPRLSLPLLCPGRQSKNLCLNRLQAVSRSAAPFHLLLPEDKAPRAFREVVLLLTLSGTPGFKAGPLCWHHTYSA